MVKRIFFFLFFGNLFKFLDEFAKVVWVGGQLPIHQFTIIFHVPDIFVFLFISQEDLAHMDLELLEHLLELWVVVTFVRQSYELVIKDLAVLLYALRCVSIRIDRHKNRFEVKVPKFL